MRLSLLVLLAAVGSARAEAPGGHFFLGAGASGGVWLEGDQDNPGSALSVQLDREWRSFFVSAQLLAGNLNHTELGFDLLAVKAHWVSDSPAVAPYLGAGLGYLRETHSDICFDPPCAPVTNQGAAATAEAGLLFFRARPSWHAALTLQLVEPLFKTDGLVLGFALLGARLSY